MPEQRLHFDERLVLLNVPAENKWELIEHMLDAMMEHPALADQPHLTRQMLIDAVHAREREQATGLGGGFAFPHARIPKFNGLVVCVALPEKPVDFHAADGEPARIVCLMVVPEEQPQIALRTMAMFARLMSDRVGREIVLSVKDPHALCGFITERVLGKDESVTAHDIMRAPLASIHPDTPLKQVTRTMLEHTLDAVSVVEEDGTLVGEITSEALFKVGMPDFFSQLKSISFIREFDPFEAYFEWESKALAKDVMRHDFCALPEDATLLEIVFELAVKRKAKVYVLRDGKRIGVIDRILVLDKVINI